MYLIDNYWDNICFFFYYEWQGFFLRMRLYISKDSSNLVYFDYDWREELLEIIYVPGLQTRRNFHYCYFYTFSFIIHTFLYFFLHFCTFTPLKVYHLLILCFLLKDGNLKKEVWIMNKNNNNESFEFVALISDIKLLFHNYIKRRKPWEPNSLPFFITKINECRENLL